MRLYYFILPAVIAGFISCKPTEKNYQTAYDRAYEASQRKNIEMQTGSNGIILEDMNAPLPEIVGTDTLFFSTGRKRPLDVTLPADGGNMGIAVGRYSVPTNARHHLADLIGEYPGAFIASDGEESFYVVIKQIPSKEAAAAVIKQFVEDHPDYRYIGMIQSPLVIYLYTPKDK